MRHQYANIFSVIRPMLGAVALLLTALTATGAPGPASPFEIARDAIPGNAIDPLVEAALAGQGIAPAPLCSDAVFIRRVYLDVLGILPTPAEIGPFLKDRAPGKRARLIDTLLQRDEYADYWAMKWCDVLRVKAEFPINLWPNAVQAYHRWIREAIQTNMPCDQFARALLTSSGSNFREPPVNFYRAVQGRDAASLAGVVALTFMGERIDRWPAARRAGFEAFFSRVAYKKTAEWKEEIVTFDHACTQPLTATLPDGAPVRIAAHEDPRVVFADWLIRKDNPVFAHAMANRVWAWLMGRGIVHEPDDFRPDNPPSNPALLTLLEQELIQSDYDLRHLYRLILNSRTYQQSSVARSDDPRAVALFAGYPVRRLDAEVLIDALCWISGGGESYESAIPEPFTFIPASQRAVQLADGSITSQFLEMFGRPTRDSGLVSERNNQVSDDQRLYLLNSGNIQRKIERSGRLNQLISGAKGNRQNLISGLYLNILSRYPTAEEQDRAGQYFQTKGIKPNQAAYDLAWALINTKEFLYRH